MASVDFELDTDLLNEFVESVERANGFVVYQIPYAIYVEFPTEYRGDSRPPYKPILEWVKRNINTQDPESTAWAVVEKLAEQGTDGVWFASLTVDEYRNGGASNILDSYAGTDDPLAPEKIISELLEEMRGYSNNIVENRAYDTGELRNSSVVILNQEPEDAEEVEVVSR